MSWLRTPGKSHLQSNGFAYATPYRASIDSEQYSVRELSAFTYKNALMRMARTQDGNDVAIRVIIVGNEGHNNLNILRRLATPSLSLLSSNHVLPMLKEFSYEDITIGIFPKVRGSMEESINDPSPFHNSVGDVIYMLLQALEALEFIHDQRVAHRDAFSDNFLVQWHPESLAAKKTSPRRPHVYLIDFETAVEFPLETPLQDCTCDEHPVEAEKSERYTRPPAPEIYGVHNPLKPYDPFKLDVWQLGCSFFSFRSTILGIDAVLDGLVAFHSETRMSASQALEELRNAVDSIPPVNLLIKPGTRERPYYFEHGLHPRVNSGLAAGAAMAKQGEEGEQHLSATTVGIEELKI